MMMKLLSILMAGALGMMVHAFTPSSSFQNHVMQQSSPRMITTTSTTSLAGKILPDDDDSVRNESKSRREAMMSIGAGMLAWQVFLDDANAAADKTCLEGEAKANGCSDCPLYCNEGRCLACCTFYQCGAYCYQEC